MNCPLMGDITSLHCIHTHTVAKLLGFACPVRARGECALSNAVFLCPPSLYIIYLPLLLPMKYFASRGGGALWIVGYRSNYIGAAREKGSSLWVYIWRTRDTRAEEFCKIYWGHWEDKPYRTKMGQSPIRMRWGRIIATRCEHQRKLSPYK